MKLTFNEFKNLAGWGRHTHIWGGSGAWNKTCQDWRYYENNRLRETFSKEELEIYPLVVLAMDYDFDSFLREKIRAEAIKNQEWVNKQLRELGEI